METNKKLYNWITKPRTYNVQYINCNNTLLGKHFNNEVMIKTDTIDNKKPIKPFIVLNGVQIKFDY